MIPARCAALRCVAFLTWANDERFSSTAAQTVPQRLRFDVEVEKRDLAAQLTESEPDADEVRLVVHQQRHDIAVFQTAVRPQHVCESVTPRIHVPVGEDLLLEHNEGFLRDVSGLQLKALEICDNSALHPRHHRAPHAPNSRVIHQIVPKVGVQLPLNEQKSDHPDGQSADGPAHRDELACNSHTAENGLC